MATFNHANHLREQMQVKEKKLAEVVVNIAKNGKRQVLTCITK